MSIIASVVALLFALTLVSSLWIAFSLFSVGIITLELFKNLPVSKILAQAVWNITTSTEVLALPLFILMAEILFQTKISQSLFEGLAPLTRRIPGRLLHVNVLGSTLFAAVCGSSAATAATVGRITLSELKTRGYREDIAVGSLAGAGTIGFLIPPSLVMIVYGVFAEVSILRLFIAGIVPGLILAAAFSLYLAIRASLSADIVPPGEMDQGAFSFRDMWKLAPVLLLITAVVGSMYGGLASPTEAAAVGVVGALVVAALQRSLGFVQVRAALESAVRTSSMIGLILAAGGFLSVSLNYLGISRWIASEITNLNLSPLMLILLLLVFYIAIGCVLDGMSTMITTLPITLPIIALAGYDKIWFGVFIVLTIEMAQITPPIGFNLFVIQSLSGVPIGRVAVAALPFFLILIGFTLFLVAFPNVVTWLPSRMG
jgi:tripartite ATP-independent transporter DctM subunit